MARILIVDDDVDVLKMTADYLTREGHEVLRASSPLQAFDVLKASPADVDLMVIDAVLPTMSGPEFAEEMVGQHPGVKILFMTGLDAFAVTLAFGKPCDSIHKPFQLHALKSKIAEMLKPA